MFMDTPFPASKPEAPISDSTKSAYPYDTGYRLVQNLGFKLSFLIYSTKATQLRLHSE